MVAPVLSVAVFPRDILAIVFMDGRMGSMERETKGMQKTQLRQTTQGSLFMYREAVGKGPPT